MRIKLLMVLPLLGGVMALPAPAPAQVNIGIRFGARLGPEIGVFAYSQERYGDWRTSYSRWTPVTLYDINGHYYRTQVTGSRPVQVYTYHNEYFLPPQDDGWVNRDRRFNNGRRPGDDDYRRARPWSQDWVSVDPAHEIGVWGYAPDRDGDWRRNYRRWTPVTVYELRGHYYTVAVRGSRPVALYRYQNEYFLPPQDQGWMNFDRRFDYKHLPDNDDRGRARIRP